jgi:hypothetical protein
MNGNERSIASEIGSICGTWIGVSLEMQAEKTAPARKLAIKYPPPLSIFSTF